MIFKAIKTDEQKLIDFWLKEIEFNTFNIGDLYAFGTENNTIQSIWFQEREGEVIATLLDYKENIVFYYPRKNEGHVDFLGFFEILKERKVSNISVMAYVWSGLEPYLNYELDEELIMQLCSLTLNHAKIGNTEMTQLAIPTDANECLYLEADIFGNKINETEIEFHSDSIKETRIITACVKLDEQIISKATLTAISNSSAMIVGVCTKKTLRGQGYARACMSRLIEEAKIIGLKNLVLFYDNPNAGKLYHDLGFKTIDQWAVVKIK